MKIQKIQILQLSLVMLINYTSSYASNKSNQYFVQTPIQSLVQQKQILIPAGDFLMGCSSLDTKCDADEGRVGGRRVYVPEFKIDSLEISVSEFRQCVTDKACQRPFDTKRNKYCNYDNPARDNHPVNCVSWQHAKQYCDWKQGRLLLEAEWEKAARAGINNKRYSWGNTAANCRYAIMDDGITKTKKQGNETDGCGEDRTWPRASRAANAYGLFDMNGGVAEWVNNWYHSNAIQQFYSKGEIHSPQHGTRKVIRGGAWDEKAWALSNSGRWAKTPTGDSSLYGSNGIRCGYSVKKLE